MGGKLISEQDVIQAGRRGARSLPVEPGTIVTPSARDAAGRLGITLDPVQTSSSKGGQGNVVSYEPASRQKKAEVLALGCDHGGFPMKEALRPLLLELGYHVLDVGTHSTEACDYPDYAYAVSALVASGKASRGIMIDSVGHASAIVCNKVPGIRAVAPTTEMAAKSSREHNDANVLALGGKTLGVEVAKSLAGVWLETWFGGGRHQARLNKIRELEEKYSRRT